MEIDAQPKGNAFIRCLKKSQYNPLSEFFKFWIGRFFFFLGKQIVRWPILFIVGSVVGVLLCGVGVLNLERETRTEYLWVVTSADTWEHFQEHSEVFGSRRVEAMLATPKTEGADMLSKDLLLEMLDLHERTMDITVQVNGQNFTYVDICYRLYPEAACTFNSPLVVWGYNKTLIQLDNDLHQTITPYAEQLSAVIGGVQKDGQGKIIKIGGMLMGYFLEGKLTQQKDYNTAINDWESDFSDSALADNNNFINVYVNSHSSADREIQRLVATDTKLVVGSVILTLVFMSLILGKRSLVHSKIVIGMMTLLTVLLSLIASIGLAGIFGIPYTPITIAVIFILIGIGVDDMIIIVDAFQDKTNIADLPEDRLPRSLAISGFAIFITSITDFMAFMLAGFVDLKGITAFCQLAGIAVFMLFVLQITFFSPILLFDAKRAKASRMDLLPCIKRKNASKEEDATTLLGGSVMKKFIGQKYAPFLMRTPVKIVVIIFFILLTAGSAFLSQYTTTVIPTGGALPDDSYARVFYTETQKYFASQPVPLDIVIRDEEYQSAEVRAKITALAETLRAEDLRDRVIVPPVNSWLDAYEAWAVNRSQASMSFYPQLREFLDENQEWTGDIVFQNSQRDKISHSRLRTDLINAKTNEIRIQDMKTVQNIMEESDLDAFAWSSFFGYNNRDDQILKLVLTNLGLAAGAVILTVLILLGPLIAIFVGICIIMIDLDLFAVMVVFDIALDGVSFTVLAMAIGLSVDYCAHIGVAFFQAKSASTHQRVIEALRDIGSSVFNGGFSTLLGVVVLAFASSSNFQTFFYILFGTVFFGLLHGLVFFPVIMSLLPSSIAIVHPYDFEFKEDAIELDIATERKKKAKKSKKTKKAMSRSSTTYNNSVTAKKEKKKEDNPFQPKPQTPQQSSQSQDSRSEYTPQSTTGSSKAQSD